jgi:FkbM family methyltransferase
VLDRYLSPGDGVIDLGANVGRYTEAYAKRVGSRGLVLAVEPEAKNFAELVSKVSGYAWVECVNAVVSGPVAPMFAAPFFVDGGDRRRSSCWAKNRILDGPEQFPALETLDNLARTVPNLRAIKMDVQGAECHVLDGAQETLGRDLVWAVELWPAGLKNAGRSIDELAQVFLDHGYQVVGDRAGRRLEQIVGAIRDYDGHKSTDVVLKRTSPEMSR